MDTVDAIPSPRNESAADEALLQKINTAVTAVNKAEKAAETAKAELVSRSKAVGELLLEAKRRHPEVADFKAFLKKVDGLKLSRAYDLLRLAGGRVTNEQLRQEARERQWKARANKKLPKSGPEPRPGSEPKDSVTKPHVTESPEVSVEQRKAEMAALDSSAGEGNAKASARALAEFVVACRTWLPKITVDADRQRARLLVAKLTSAPKAEAA
jgi:hypothetical protein